jgi:mannose-6-phosphate isomerase-like protein (cupin superfamily)
MSRVVEKRSIQLEEVPSEVNRYWKRIVVTEQDRIESGTGAEYIGPEVCGALTINCGTFEIPPGYDKGDKEMHSHAQEEVCYILSGRGWVAVEDEVYHFQAGDFVWCPAFARHGWGNDEGEPVKVLFCRPIRPEPPESYHRFGTRRFNIVSSG